MFNRTILFLALLLPFAAGAHGTDNRDGSLWLAVHTPTKYERSALVNAGVSIETVVDDTSYVFATPDELEKIRGLGFAIDKMLPAAEFQERDFPTQDSVYHNYSELVADMQKLAADYSSMITMFSIGKSKEGRDIWALRFGANGQQPGANPAAIFMGGHHAREHLSVEMPFLLAKYLADNYGHDDQITRLLNTREIFIVPQVNPDGSEYDIGSGNYRMWRKNRADNNGNSCRGVDLNRNYGYFWNTGGSSTDPCSEIYMGPKAFSEPETVAVKNFVEAHPNAKVLLTFHTFSELILYPWGHTYDDISNADDLSAFEKMAHTMAGWNNYTPEPASGFYIASGDTVDWAYGTLGIFAFTFELSPSQWSAGGFYPGAAAIDSTFRANPRPALYLIDLADDPHRAVRAPQTTLFYGK